MFSDVVTELTPVFVGTATKQTYILISNAQNAQIKHLHVNRHIYVVRLGLEPLIA